MYWINQFYSIFLQCWQQGRDAAIDITVVNPLQTALVAKVAQEGGSAVGKAHEGKVRKY